MRAKKRSSVGVVVALVTLVLTVMGGSARAAGNYDQVKPVVTVPAGNPIPIVQNNGTVPGTIQLLYTINANTFTAGFFGRFQINFSILAGSTTATYSPTPPTLSLEQNGSSNVDLTFTPDSFSVTGRAWTGSAQVDISIPSDVPSDPSLNTDGYTLVGNINMSAEGRSHLGTPTTIQVKLILVHSSDACLKLYDFIVNNDTGDIITSATYTVGHGQNPTVNGTQPGGILDSILVANTCPVSETFDVLAALDANFETKPKNNPGNAVFTYATSSIVSPSTFSLGAFGSGAGQQQNLCLSAIALPAGNSFLMTVKLQVKDNVTPPLPTASFSGSLYSANSVCGGSLNSLVSPNPASATLTFTQQN